MVKLLMTVVRTVVTRGITLQTQTHEEEGNVGRTRPVFINKYSFNSFFIVAVNFLDYA
jgi:hypothetical protein